MNSSPFIDENPMILVYIFGALITLIVASGLFLFVKDKLAKWIEIAFRPKPTKDEIAEQHRCAQELRKENEQYRKDELDRMAFEEFVKKKLASEENRKLARETLVEYYKTIRKEFDASKKAA